MASWLERWHLGDWAELWLLGNAKYALQSGKARLTAIFETRGRAPRFREVELPRQQLTFRVGLVAGKWQGEPEARAHLRSIHKQEVAELRRLIAEAEARLERPDLKTKRLKGAGADEKRLDWLWKHVVERWPVYKIAGESYYSVDVSRALREFED